MLIKSIEIKTRGTIELQILISSSLEIFHKKAF